VTDIIEAIETQPARPCGPRRDPHAFLEGLVAEALDHPALRHPWLGAMEQRAFPDMRAACRDFALVYHGYCAWFPFYLQAVIDKLDGPRHATARARLVRNLSEENGCLGADGRARLAASGIPIASVQGVPHRELFRHFCAALGLGARELQDVPIESAAWRVSLRGFLERATIAEGVGALGLGTECILVPLYARLLAGIAGTPGLTRADTVFFELHCRLDERHGSELLALAAELATTPEGRSGLRRGMLKALALRLAVWDALWLRAQHLAKVA